MFTNSQLVTLKAAILADSAMTAAYTAGDMGAVSELLNAASVHSVWRTVVPVKEIYDTINWANLTPADVPDSTVLYTNRTLICQTKQMNLQLILQGREYIDASKSNIRSGLQDALTKVPSAAGGQQQPAGWTQVLGVLSRKATVAEFLFVSGSTDPYTIGWEGMVNVSDVIAAINGGY